MYITVLYFSCSKTDKEEQQHLFTLAALCQYTNNHFEGSLQL